MEGEADNELLKVCVVDWVSFNLRSGLPKSALAMLMFGCLACLEWDSPPSGWGRVLTPSPFFFFEETPSPVFVVSIFINNRNTARRFEL